jgi:hypothetical protein
MSGNDPFEAWKRERAAEPVPEGFADRVVSRLDDAPRRPRRLLPIVLVTTAGLAGLARVAAVLALLLTE